MSFDLTRAQEVLWASQQIHEGTPLYNMAFLFRIDGHVDEGAFTRAFAALVEDADALRTVITTSAGSARQRVSDAIDFTLPVVDLSDRDDPFETAQVWSQEQCA
ncbi:MAG: condensation domain-containing protein [Acidimicrobiia bacterium]